MTPESRFVEVNGLRFHYLTWRGDAILRGPVILFHATGFLARLWEPVAVRLAEAGYEVIAPDARGHGDSEKPEVTQHNYDWHRFADDQRAFLDKLGLRGVPVVGHSMGGGCALFVAGHHSEYFSRIVVYEPIVMPGGFHPDESERERMAAGARKRRAVFESADAMIEQYRQRPTFANWRDDALRIYAEDGTFVREDGHRELKCSGRVEGEVFSNSGSLDIWPVLPNVAAPTLVMRGEQDERGFMTMVSEGVAERVPGARLKVMAGMGHLGPMEAPDVVAGEIVGFLNAESAE